MAKNNIMSADQTISLLSNVVQDLNRFHHIEMQRLRQEILEEIGIFSGGEPGLVPESPLPIVHVYLYNDEILHFTNNDSAQENHQVTQHWQVDPTKTTGMPEWYSYLTQNKISEIIVDENTQVGYSMNYWFFQVNVDISQLAHFNTSHVRTMQHTFEDAKITNVTALKNWNVSNVKDMQHMFTSCSQLTNIDGLSEWKTSSVTNLSYMFEYCSSMTNYNALMNWDVSRVTDFSFMFYSNTNLKVIGALSNWDVSNGTTFAHMFQYCTQLTYIPLFSFNGSQWGGWRPYSAQSFNYFCANCTALLSLSGFEFFRIYQSTCTLQSMFTDCISLKDISDLQYFNTQGMSARAFPASFIAMFNNCSAVQDFTSLNNWDMSKSTVPAAGWQTLVFSGCYGTLPDWATEE